jgi:hypothetical protein
MGKMKFEWVLYIVFTSSFWDNEGVLSAIA